MTRRLTIAAATALALVAAGCGVRNSKPFTATGTAPCLRDHGFSGVTRSRLKIGFVAAFAENGGVKATSPTGNTVTIAFTVDSNSVDSTENAFRTHAPKAVRPHMADIMQTNRNAVLVWTTTPKGDELDTVTRCLSP
ncbi:MAG TPA: hypothetical protein VFI01_04250 [Gaiellaceae bacterium]|nr:hypothetical protein [Gaiellaceae bacterium]